MSKPRRYAGNATGRLGLMRLCYCLSKRANVISPEGRSKSSGKERFDTELMARLKLATQTTKSLKISVLNIHYVTTLRNREVHTLGDLIDLAHQKGVEFRSLRPTVRQEIFAQLDAIAHALDDRGEIDWESYAIRLGLRIIPSVSTGADSFYAASSISATCEEVVKSNRLEQYSKDPSTAERDLHILQRRILCRLDDRDTLDHLGFAFGFSRERTRQIQESIAGNIRQTIVLGNHSGLDLRIHPTLSRAFAVAEDRLCEGDGIWRQTKWIEVISASLRIAPAHLERQILLFLSLFNCERLQFDSDEIEPLVSRRDMKSEIVLGVKARIESIHLILCERAEAMAPIDLLVQLKKSLGSRKGLNIQDIPVLASLCSSVETVDVGGGAVKFRAKFEALKNRADQAVRVLEMRGGPTPIREVWKEINRRIVSAQPKVPGHRSLVNLLADDKRIVPIGKTGMWALASWGTETRSVFDLIEECLHRAGEPMTEQVIWGELKGKRPMSQASISMTLQSRPEVFRKIGPRTWGLVEWGVGAEVHKLSHESIGQFVEGFFAQQSGDQVEFHLLRRLFMENTSVSARAAQGILILHPAVCVVREGARKRFACFNPDWRQTKRPLLKKGRSKPTQRDLVTEFVRARILASPRREVQLIQVAKLIERELAIPRATVYGIVDKMEDVEKIAVRSGAPKILRLLGGGAARGQVSPGAQLHQFMVNAFSIERLERFVFAWPDILRRRGELPNATVGLAHYAQKLIELIQQEGVVLDVFERLAAEFPEKRPEIERIRVAFRS